MKLQISHWQSGLDRRYWVVLLMDSMFDPLPGGGGFRAVVDDFGDLMLVG